MEFKYQDPFEMGKDKTEYYLLTKDYVSTTEFEGKEVLKVEPEGLTLLAKTAMRDCNFLLRTEHQQQVAKILDDPKPAKMINMWLSPCCVMQKLLQRSIALLSGYRNRYCLCQERPFGLYRWNG